MKAVNLIPTEQRRAQATGRRPGSSYVVIGLLATLLAMVAAYVFTANRVTERQNETAATKAEADRLEAQAAQQKEFTNFAQVKATRLASVSTIAQTRFDWERLMRELSRVVPSGSWVQTTDASVTGNVAGAESSTTPTAAGAAAVPQPKANLVGCTPDQSDVARMMVRLRQLHRVSDVELNESVKQLGTSGEASVDNCGSLYQFDLMVSFEPTDLQNEAPRGESVVPASLGGGS
jgi:Tfp pilus assembly protein PilN